MALDGHALSKRKKVPITDGEMMPLLRCKGGKPLKHVPAVTAAPVQYGIGIKVIRTGAGANAGGGEKFDMVDLESERILAAGYGQPPVLDKPSPDQR